jgi:hypothetical protein
VRRVRVAVHLRVDRLAELDGALDARAVREAERELARLLVPLGADADDRAVALVVEEPAVLVDEPEAPVAAHAVELEVDLLRVDEPERLDRCDRDANDARLLHAVKLTQAAGPSTCASLRPRVPSSSKTQKSRPVTWTATL